MKRVAHHRKQGVPRHPQRRSDNMNGARRCRHALKHIAAQHHRRVVADRQSIHRNTRRAVKIQTRPRDQPRDRKAVPADRDVRARWKHTLRAEQRVTKFVAGDEDVQRPHSGVRVAQQQQHGTVPPRAAIERDVRHFARHRPNRHRQAHAAPAERHIAVAQPRQPAAHSLRNLGIHHVADALTIRRRWWRGRHWWQCCWRWRRASRHRRRDARIAVPSSSATALAVNHRRRQRCKTDAVHRALPARGNSRHVGDAVELQFCRRRHLPSRDRQAPSNEPVAGPHPPQQSSRQPRRAHPAASQRQHTAAVNAHKSGTTVVEHLTHSHVVVAPIQPA
ncbi:hypothetical protein TCDM_13494 [Trypanosoma cruzi Dm28c]|uniref:Uncharacterized protein n=1 Tax=Trypanosoma cruzi Dm28c TaxID=1416333 RepID=V5AN58_TRYCR|nr:hypothetical protein TCDM_13494 [Trypanosoma cruzi Dm28c]